MDKIKNDRGSISFIDKYAIPYYIFIVYFGTFYLLLEYTKKPVYTVWFILIFQYIGKALPKDKINIPVEEAKYHNNNLYHIWPLVANVFGTWILLIYTWKKYSSENYNIEDYIMLAQSVGMLISASINASHQLFHKPFFWAKVLSYFNMAIFQFSVYQCSHVYHHHKHVGTSKDPITCPKNKNIYEYTLNAYIEGHKFTYSYSKTTFYICKILDFSLIAIMALFAYWQFGDWAEALKKIGYFLLIGLIGFVMLELVQYIQHYGLVIKENTDKNFIQLHSSWNSDDNIILNWFSFKFQRHTDHHMNAYKYYSTIDLNPQMAYFRFNFFQGMLMCLIPKLWYYIMNPLVDEYLQHKQLSQNHKANIFKIKESFLLLLTVYLGVKSLFL